MHLGCIFLAKSCTSQLFVRFSPPPHTARTLRPGPPYTRRSRGPHEHCSTRPEQDAGAVSLDRCARATRPPLSVRRASRRGLACVAAGASALPDHPLHSVNIGAPRTRRSKQALRSHRAFHNIVSCYRISGGRAISPRQRPLPPPRWVLIHRYYAPIHRPARTRLWLSSAAG